MTITRRGLRKIVVDGHEFVWSAGKHEGKRAGFQWRSVVIADASRRGSILTLPDPRGSFYMGRRTQGTTSSPRP